MFEMALLLPCKMAIFLKNTFYLGKIVTSSPQYSVMLLVKCWISHFFMEAQILSRNSGHLCTTIKQNGLVIILVFHLRSSSINSLTNSHICPLMCEV